MKSSEIYSNKSAYKGINHTHIKSSSKCHVSRVIPIPIASSACCSRNYLEASNRAGASQCLWATLANVLDSHIMRLSSLISSISWLSPLSNALRQYCRLSTCIACQLKNEVKIGQDLHLIEIPYVDHLTTLTVGFTLQIGHVALVQK